NFYGSDSFTFKINDGSLNSNIATVSIDVIPVQDPPVANNQFVATGEDQAKSITLSASDPDNDPLTYTIAAGPTNGSLSGTPPNVTYQPNANFNGGDSFPFYANDGIANSNTATVNITILANNDAPVAHAQSVTTNEDTVKAITLAGTDADGDPLSYIMGAA